MHEHEKARTEINALSKSVSVGYTFDGEINEQVA